MSYEVKDLTVGILHPQIVKSVLMPRADFLRVVSEQIASYEGCSYATDDQIAQLREAIWPVAETMPRFPFSQWLNTNRGCGCVIGEYLIARAEIDEINREQFISEYRRGPAVSTSTVYSLLAEHPIRGLLLKFGSDIDHRLKDAVEKSTRLSTDAYVGGGIRSIEIID